MTGDDTGIGTLVVLDAEPNAFLRLAAIGPLALLLIVSFLASASQRRVYEKAADWLFYGAVAGALALAGALAVAGAGAGAGAVAGALAVAGAVAGALALAVAGALAVALAVAGALALAVAVGVGLACQKRKGHRAYVGLVGASYVLLTAAFASVASELADNRKVLVFALGLLPLLNAVFDYLSYGVTLTLIKFGAARKNVWSFGVALIDAVVAYGLLVALGSSIVLTLGLINLLADGTFMDVGSILDGLRDPAARGNYTWLYLTLFSTLVPTGVHLVVGCSAFTTWLPMRAKVWIADQILREDTGSLGTMFARRLRGVDRGDLVLRHPARTCVAGGSWILDNLDDLGLAILSHVEFVARLFGVVR